MIIKYTRHALDRMSKYLIDEIFVRKIIEEGLAVKEGKTKVQFVYKSKRDRWIAVCGKIKNGYLVITVIKTRV